jgi:hypothetical protein
MLSSAYRGASGDVHQDRPRGQSPSRRGAAQCPRSIRRERRFLLYHRPGLKNAINNIKEEEDWEVLLVAHPGCISDTESAVHEFVHKFSLYNNRLECPTRGWEEFLSAMKAYRREMSRR